MAVSGIKLATKWLPEEVKPYTQETQVRGRRRVVKKTHWEIGVREIKQTLWWQWLLKQCCFNLYSQADLKCSAKQEPHLVPSTFRKHLVGPTKDSNGYHNAQLAPCWEIPTYTHVVSKQCLFKYFSLCPQYVHN